jgi:hypothetical protein
MSDKLVKTSPKFKLQQFGLEARINNANSGTEDNIKLLPNRIGIVFDDSGSMYGEKIKTAHEGLDVFIKNCNSNETAIALYPMNAERKNLSTDYAEIGLFGMTIGATGSTPLYETLSSMLAEEDITRGVAFSDGSPSRDFTKESCFAEYQLRKVPVDAIFIGEIGDGDAAMKELAVRTGGIFLHLTDPSLLSKALKYLTPAYRAMLMNPEIKAKVERGEL